MTIISRRFTTEARRRGGERSESRRHRRAETPHPQPLSAHISWSGERGAKPSLLRDLRASVVHPASSNFKFRTSNFPSPEFLP